MYVMYKLVLYELEGKRTNATQEDLHAVSRKEKAQGRERGRKKNYRRVPNKFKLGK